MENSSREGTFTSRLRRIMSVMVPILITQMAIQGLSLFDTVMSGHAGTNELAGVAIGANIWMPLFTGLNGIQQALTPIVANYRGAGENKSIAGAVFSGLVLSCLLTVLVITAGILFLPSILGTMNLTPEVYRVAYRYLGFSAFSVLPLFASNMLRCFVDSMGYTQVNMRLFLLTVPINAAMNYIFIFGKLGAPALGGPGAGVGTSISCWILLLCFVVVLKRLKVFAGYRIFDPSGFSFAHLREHLRVGLPMGVGIFMETSIFGVECLFVARFGTIAVAANQAAMSFCSMLYMIPLSFSLALTILVGAYVGAADFRLAKKYASTGRLANLMTGAFFAAVLLLGRDWIAALYTTDPSLIGPIKHFLIFAVAFQFCDSTAAPIQGVLRGYKDVKATFYSALAAYWLISLPAGLFLDHGVHLGPDGYWLGLITGIFFSALFLTLRLRYIERKFSGPALE